MADMRIGRCRKRLSRQKERKKEDVLGAEGIVKSVSRSKKKYRRVGERRKYRKYTEGKEGK